MEQFEVHILGCGSALPTTRHNPSSQIVRVGNELFMIDCGEGTQLQIRKSHQHFSRINNIFISHLHGDHCFGLIGLISTFGLLGRKHPLHIYAHPMMRSLLMPQIEYFCQGMQYEVILHDINPKEAAVIYEDNNVTVETLPLNHRIPCCGFLISEKPKKRHLRGEMAEYYNIPTYARQRIREGEDYTTPEGETIPNERLTTPPDASRRYVYCGRTSARMAKIKGRSDDMLIIKGVNVFPSQIESLLLGMPYVGPHYELIVTKKGYMDQLEIKVELLDASLLEKYAELEALTHKIREKVRSNLLIDAKITLAEPKSLERYVNGKAKRVHDLRNQ